MHVRAGRAAGHAGGTERFALGDMLADLHVDAREVEEVRTHAVAVVDDDRAAGEIGSGSANVTIPLAGACTGVPVGTAMSMPECGDFGTSLPSTT